MHELGSVTKLPLDALPLRVRSIELIVIGMSPRSAECSERGMLAIEVSRPKSPGRTLTDTGSLTLSTTEPPISGVCTQMPSRAGSPELGVTSYTLSVTLSVTGRSPRGVAVTLFVTLPTMLAPGQVSALNCACVHFVAAFGFPTRPGGRWTVRFLRLSLEPVNVVSIPRLG